MRGTPVVDQTLHFLFGSEHKKKQMLTLVWEDKTALRITTAIMTRLSEQIS